MNKTFKIAAAALMATTLAAPVWAQTETTEPDCPEDMDTEPGCDMSGADVSEPGPVEGAATAPVPEGVEEGEGSTTMEESPAEPEDTGADAPEPQDTEADSSESSDAEADSTSSDAAMDSAEDTDSAAAEPTSHEVKPRGLVFDPVFIYVEPGDTVNWTSMASHNVETLDGMVPEGQEKINSELGANVSETFDTVGIVAYKCTPHWGNRMGGMVVVGTPEDAGAIIDDYLQQAEDNPENLPALGLLKKLRADMIEKGMIEA